MYLTHCVCPETGLELEEEQVVGRGTATIQQSIPNHPNFDYIMESILNEITEKQPKTIGIFCNYGET